MQRKEFKIAEAKEREMKEPTIQDELETAKESLIEVINTFYSLSRGWTLTLKQKNDFIITSEVILNIVDDLLDGLKKTRPDTRPPEWKSLQERSELCFIRVTFDNPTFHFDMPIHMENHARIMGKKSPDQKTEEVIEEIPAGEPRARRILESIVKPFIACFKNVQTSTVCLQKFCDHLAPSSEGCCLDARTRSAFDYALSDDIATPTFVEMLQHAVLNCALNKEDNYFYLIASLMQNWGKKFKADRSIFGCKTAGTLDLNAQPIIFKGIQEYLARGDDIDHSLDFLHARHQLPKGLEADYFKLIFKKPDFFKTLSIKDSEQKEKKELIQLIYSPFLERDFLSFVSQECKEPGIASQLLINTLPQVHEAKASFWLNEDIFIPIDLKRLPFNKFIAIMNYVGPNVLTKCLEKFNPFNHPEINDTRRFNETLNSIQPKLAPDLLFHLILDAKSIPIPFKNLSFDKLLVELNQTHPAVIAKSFEEKINLFNHPAIEDFQQFEKISNVISLKLKSNPVLLNRMITNIKHIPIYFECLYFDQFLEVINRLEPAILAKCLELQAINPFDHHGMENVKNFEAILKILSVKFKSMPDLLLKIISNAKNFLSYFENLSFKEFSIKLEELDPSILSQFIQNKFNPFNHAGITNFQKFEDIFKIIATKLKSAPDLLSGLILNAKNSPFSFKILSFEEYLVFIDKINPTVLIKCLEQKFNPFDHPAATGSLGFALILEKVAPKLKPDLLCQLLLDKKTMMPITSYILKLLQKIVIDPKIIIKMILSKNNLSNTLNNEEINEQTKSELLILTMNLILTTAQTQPKSLINLIEKNITYDNKHTNFLGYIILSSSFGVLKEERTYYPTLAIIPPKILFEMFNNMGLETFNISIDLLDKIISILDPQDRQKLFAKHFKIEKPVLINEQYISSVLDMINKLTSQEIDQLFVRMNVLSKLLVEHNLYKQSLAILKNSPDKQAVLEKYFKQYSSEKEIKSMRLKKPFIMPLSPEQLIEQKQTVFEKKDSPVSIAASLNLFSPEDKIKKETFKQEGINVIQKIFEDHLDHGLANSLSSEISNNKLIIKLYSNTPKLHKEKIQHILDKLKKDDMVQPDIEIPLYYGFEENKSWTLVITTIPISAIKNNGQNTLSFIPKMA